MEQSDKPPSLIPRLQSANKNITGSPSYWYTKSTQLKHGIEQKNCGTLFISHSMADSYWPELHRLLGTEKKNQTLVQKCVGFKTYCHGTRVIPADTDTGFH